MNPHCKIGKVTPKLSVVEPMPYPINYDAVQQSQKLAEDCATGEFRSIAICAISARGYVHTAYAISGQENPVLMQGAVTWLNDRIADAVRGDNYDRG